MRNIMQKIKVYLTILMISFGFGVAAMVPQVASADTAQSVVCGTLGGGSNCSGTNPNGSVGIDSTITAAINILSIVVGVVAVITIIVCGLRMITSQGDANSFATARTGIIYAVVGLCVVLLAQAIVQFVLAKVKS